MNKTEAKKRIEALRSQIEDLRYRYHVLDDPKVTDEVYDSLTRELKALEKEYPEFYDPSSPTERVGGKALDKFVKIRHQIPMLSLNDAFSEQEVWDWEKRVTKLLPGHARLNYFCELKMDGLAVSLIYEKGLFVRGSTRGDGQMGEDITQNLKTLESVPLRLRGPAPEFLEVRGEAVMSKKVLESLNKKNEKEGKPLFANTRNSAAGSLRQLDPKLTAERRLEFFAWDIVQIKNAKIQNHSDKHQLLRQLGFKVNENEKKCSDLEEVLKFIGHIAKLRENFKYGSDGVVISVDNLELQNRLGVVGKAPRYMLAYKYPAEKATTQILDIKVNVGRTGVLTPLAVFKPTLVAGSTIAKATLHNLDQIERLDVRIGDTVVIQKAGDVIPEVVEALPKLRTGKERKFHMPEKCPVCGGRVEKRTIGEKKEVSTAYYCSNPKCPAKNRRFMQHFVAAFDIYEVGPKILDRFQEEGLISDAADLFSLKKEDIEGLERFGEKSAENIINSIAEHKKISLANFIYALGILHVGEQTAEDLAEHFGSLEKLQSASLEQVNELSDIGPVIAKSVYEYFHQKENLKFIDKLSKNGVTVHHQQKPKGKFTGKTFVITGTLENMSRDEAKNKIKQLGGKTSESVSKETSFVVVGSEPGSKFQKAEKLGIKILDEKEFLKLVV